MVIPARFISENLPELLAGDGIDAVGRFVEDQELRLVDEDAGEPQFLLHPAGEVSRRPVGKGQQVGEAEVEGLPRLRSLAPGIPKMFMKKSMFSSTVRSW